MKAYEIINPSDQVTIIAESERHACAAVILLSEGFFGLRDEQGETVCPLFAFGGDVEAWFQERYGAGFSATLEDTEQIAAVLETAATCSLSKRALYDRALQAITDEDKRGKFIADWDDRARTSMNAIARQAHDLAAHLRASKPLIAIV